MDGLNVEGDEEAAGKRGSGDPGACSHGHARHKRSKRSYFVFLFFIFYFSA